MSLFICLERGLWARPQEGLRPIPRPLGDLLQETLYNRFWQENFLITGVGIERHKRRDIRPTTMHRSEDRATKKAERGPSTGDQSESRVAKKAPRNNYYLESYTTVPNQLGRRDARLLCSRRGLAKDLLLQILYNPAGVESLLVILRAPRPAAPPRALRGKVAFYF